MNRREAIKTTLAGTALGTIALTRPGLLRGAGQTPPPYQLPALPYAFDALEPHLDARTMAIHYSKHHAAYVSKLNDALTAAPEWAGRSIEALLQDLESVPESVRGAVRNNGGGHYNHSLFWRMLSRTGGGQPRGELADAIDKSFGGYEPFRAAFTQAALGQFGSGWAWLTRHQGTLQVETTPNQDSPLTAGRTPLLGIDVWEHAYYLKYQNRRADYITAWWNVVNWEFVADRNAEAKRR